MVCDGTRNRRGLREKRVCHGSFVLCGELGHAAALGTGVEGLGTRNYRVFFNTNILLGKNVRYNWKTPRIWGTIFCHPLGKNICLHSHLGTMTRAEALAQPEY